MKAQTLGGHFHCHSIGLLSIVEYALAAKDRETIEWCRSSFEWARNQGSSLVGFFPEVLVEDYPSCESCEVADMIGVGLKLSEAGAGDYWDDVDRWVRNQFAENQLTDGEWIYQMAESMPKRPVAFNETAVDLAKRNVGGFAGWASGNEWALKHGIMHCCTGNSTRALYYFWQNILQAGGPQADGQTLRLNLLLNRASAWADVHSFIPYEGRVRLKVKKPLSAALIRVPQWVETSSPELTCKVNGRARLAVWKGRYVDIGAAQPGETVELFFPIATRTVTEKIGTRPYKLEIRGNTVVSIDPPGRCGALYQRAHYRENQVAWRKVERFVPSESILW